MISSIDSSQVSFSPTMRTAASEEANVQTPKIEETGKNASKVDDVPTAPEQKPSNTQHIDIIV